MIGINVLSLFDGISCGQLALQRLGIPVARYYASEIDTDAIYCTRQNFPNTIHIGDVTRVKAKDLPPIDLLIAGSPCQGFSLAGKGLNFSDPRSALFFEFVRLKRECQDVNPDLRWMLENVNMRPRWREIISKFVGVQPLFFDSMHMSASKRERLYWCSHRVKIEAPRLGGPLFDDIIDYKDRSYIRTTLDRRLDYELDLAFRGRSPHQDLARRVLKTNCVMTYPAATPGYKGVARCYLPNALKAEFGLTYLGVGNLHLLRGDGPREWLVRQLNAVELERAMTMPCGFTAPMTRLTSNPKDAFGRRHHAIGNAWTVAVIERLFDSLLHSTTPIERQALVHAA